MRSFDLNTFILRAYNFHNLIKSLKLFFTFNIFHKVLMKLRHHWILPRFISTQTFPTRFTSWVLLMRLLNDRAVSCIWILSRSIWAVFHTVLRIISRRFQRVFLRIRCQNTLISGLKLILSLIFATAILIPGSTFVLIPVII